MESFSYYGQKQLHEEEEKNLTQKAKHQKVINMNMCQIGWKWVGIESDMKCGLSKSMAVCF